MAKTELFSRLRRIASSAFASAVRATPSGAANGVLGRRELLLATAASSGAVMGCDAQPKPPAEPGEIEAQTVAVIGAGIAGLYCAYWLMQAGVDVTVYEASSRIGGRTFTGRGLLPDRLSCELGGEFIDSNHVTMQFLAHELVIALDDRSADPNFEKQVFWVAGAEIPEEKLVAQVAAITPALIAALQTADTNPRALDATPLSVWLESNVPTRQYPELSALLSAAYRAEFGLEPQVQSALNLIHLVGLDTEDFRPLGDSDRRYHAHEGSDVFAARLAGLLEERVVTSSRLTAVRANGPAHTLTFETQNGLGSEVDAARVVFALPFSVLRSVRLDSSGLSERKRQVIAELGYGTTAKIVGAFGTRVWRDSFGKSGSVTSDLGFQELWDSSVGLSESRAVLANVLGGDAGLDSDVGTAEQRWFETLTELEAIFPGVRDAYLDGSARRMHWPTAPLFRGSTSCYRYGQWADALFVGEPEGSLYFCGEHCSVDFQGRMEGAAETGALTAARILDDLALAHPERLAELLAAKLVVPQPCYPVAGTPAMGLLARRQRILESHAAFAEELRRGSGS